MIRSSSWVGLNPFKVKRLCEEFEQLKKGGEYQEQLQECDEECDHVWVARLDGCEEQCGPAICQVCGKYGCYCDAHWSQMSNYQKKWFEKCGASKAMTML